MNLDDVGWLAASIYVLHWGVVIGFSVRVIMRRRPVGVLLAWIAIILSVPLLGILLYLFIGENRISHVYMRRHQALRDAYLEWKKTLRRQAQVDWSTHNPEELPIGRQSQSLTGFPAMSGNRLRLLTHFEQIFRALIADIERSRSSCHLEFYIWHPGGLADELADALIAAVQRGVVCRVMVDAVGSKAFLNSGAARRLEQGGVQLARALPTGPVSALLSRADLRNHRKIAVIDGEIGYTGSQNLVDPRYFKQEGGFGQWVDAMLRIEGPVVEALAGLFIQDWEVVTGVAFESFSESTNLRRLEPVEKAVAQLAPSGPQPNPLAILQLVVSTIYAARRELLITTPYFVPDETVLMALMSVAHSGVEVTLVIPAKNDSRLVDYASRSVFADLLSAGVRIARFEDGLLHTKSITVDGEFCLFGSVNLDMRSLWLNFELSLFIYDVEMTRQIRELQLDYIRRSTMASLKACEKRSLRQRFLDNAAHLLAPLL